ncbi:hypothetical protein QNH10_06140 [Sporosarcina thermotolerans]|uniref:hypothetical protein n=1 Tax=Sporosarcina thermotolerans TaxID=633404 RepID=UPI0024BC3358|nr:hypothetical protein [Sporosarcina thermotolerans]WHT49200.1 hypothetical protein QNH10_06140 [Sporosarcina thermotolerans]
MLNQNETRHIFMAISLGILVISPVFLLLVPSFIANSLYQEPNTWVVVVPAKVYLLYGLGVLFLFMATLLLWVLSVSKKSKWLAAICILISILFMADGAGRYVGVATDGISFKRGWRRLISTIRGVKLSGSDIVRSRMMVGSQSSISILRMKR